MELSLTKGKAAKWLKRVGIWGFVFFLAKGIIWLLVGYFILGNKP